jgi:signal transduction histidine kinase/integral membrane sensor domain MASE1
MSESSETPTTASPIAEHHHLPLALGLLLFIPIAFLGNQLGVVLRYPEIGAAVLYPPYAALTAVLVASRRRDWIWYVLAATGVHLFANLTHFSLTWVLGADVANITRALLAASLIRWLFNGIPRLDSIPELVVFSLSAVVAAPAVGATLGATNFVLHDSTAAYWRTWAGWYVSNALTALTMLPMFLLALRAAITGRYRRFDARRTAEALALAITLVATCAIAFLLPVTTKWDLALLAYGPLPLLFWAALRFGPGGASLALTTLTFAAIWSADRGTGPFVSLSPEDTVLTLQLILVLAALPVLCIAAVGGARLGAVQLYRALLASLQDHVAIIDANGKVLEVNESWHRFADAGHACPFDRVRAGDDYFAACRSAIDLLKEAGKAEGDIVAAKALAGIQSVLSGEAQRFEMEYDQVTAGKQEWYIMRVEALERRDGGAVVTRTDVSSRRRAQLEIEEQRRELSHLARVGVLGQLSGALAHELSQPLSSILSNAEAARYLLRREAIDVKELSSILQDIVTEDRRASQVIAGLRALLKRGETRAQPEDTAELVRETMQLAHAELITRGVTATSYVEPDLPPVYVHRVQVQQVLLNLILNACEAMTAVDVGRRTLHLSASTAGHGDVRFSIRDAGTGIPAELIDRLFEPFVTTKTEGLGLGLSIARTIVAAHGGRIWAENNADGGATLHCVFSSGAVSSIVGGTVKSPDHSITPINGAGVPDPSFKTGGARRRHSPFPRS